MSATLGDLEEPPDDDAWALSGPELVCRAAVRTLGMSGAGISVMTPAGHRGTVCASDQVASQVEELQFTLGEGPCIDAFNSGGPVLISDLARSSENASRWPVFSRAAVVAGVRALFAFPIQIGAIRIGALDLYRVEPTALTPAQLSAALKLSDVVAVSLLDLRSGNTTARGDGGPVGASYRLEVHQATGMVMAQLGVGIDEAFVRLRGYAFARDISVADLARDIVAGMIQFHLEDG